MEAPVLHASAANHEPTEGAQWVLYAMLVAVTLAPAIAFAGIGEFLLRQAACQSARSAWTAATSRPASHGGSGVSTFTPPSLGSAVNHTGRLTLGSPTICNSMPLPTYDKFIDPLLRVLVEHPAGMECEHEDGEAQ